MYRYFILMSVSLHAMEPMAELKCVEETVKVSLGAQTMSTAQQWIRNTLLVTGTLQNPLGTVIGYGAERALQVAHPMMQKYVSIALEGKLHELKHIATDLKERIEKSWLPMRKEKAQLASLQAIIDGDVAKEVQIMRYGTQEHVECSRGRILDSLRVHGKSNLETLPEFTKETLLACKNTLKENIHHVDPTMMDMILTSPSSGGASPAYLDKVVTRKLEELSLKDLSVDEYLKQATDIVAQQKELTIKQKESLLMKAIVILSDYKWGRIVMRIGNRMGIKHKVAEVVRLFKTVIDWQYGHLYLSDKELAAWLESSEKGVALVKDALTLEEESLNQLIDATAAITHAWIKNRSYRSVKSNMSKLASLNEAMEKLKGH